MTWWNPKTWFSDSLSKARRLDLEDEPEDKPEATKPSKPEAPAEAPAKPKAWGIDPLNVLSQDADETVSDGHPGTCGVPYQMMTSMARVPDISAIIATRVGQLAEYGVAQENDHSLGFTFRLRDRTKEPTKAQRSEMIRLCGWLETCGDPRIDPDASFESFLNMCGRDSLTWDQAAFEVVRTRRGKVAGFVPVDGSTIRRRKPTQAERLAGRRDPNEVAYVQVVNNKVVADWRGKDFAFCIRRPRTLLATAGYGFPELEEMIGLVSWMMSADTYNAANFKHGIHSAGLIALVSKMNPSLFRAFRREFYQMLKGASQAKKTPLIQLDPENKEDIKFVNLGQSNKDMEFGEWRKDLRKVACSLFRIDPAELGYLYGNEGQSGSLTQSGPEDRIIASRERGLRPFVRAWQTWINRKVIREVAPEYELVLAGFDSETAQAKLDAVIKKVGKIMTYDEGRAEFDLPPLKTKTSGMIGDVTYVNAEGAAQPPEGGEDGEPPVEGGESPDDGATGQPEPSPGDTERVAADLLAKGVHGARRRITVEVL